METHDNSLSMLDWFEARLGTDDTLDAFRQLPVCPEHRPLNTVKCFDTRAKAYRLVFGRTSAVNAFCRFHTFAVAQERRVGAVLGMAYVDEFITVEVVLGEFPARKFLFGASNLLGAVFGEHRTRWPSSQASCLSVGNRITV